MYKTNDRWPATPEGEQEFNKHYNRLATNLVGWPLALVAVALLYWFTGFYSWPVLAGLAAYSACGQLIGYFNLGGRLWTAMGFNPTNPATQWQGQ
jgi:hypothetical protein